MDFLFLDAISQKSKLTHHFGRHAKRRTLPGSCQCVFQMRAGCLDSPCSGDLPASGRLYVAIFSYRTVKSYTKDFVRSLVTGTCGRDIRYDSEFPQKDAFHLTKPTSVTDRGPPSGVGADTDARAARCYHFGSDVAAGASGDDFSTFTRSCASSGKQMRLEQATSRRAPLGSKAMCATPAVGQRRTLQIERHSIPL